MICAKPNMLPRRQVLAGILVSPFLALLKVRSTFAIPEKLSLLIREATGGIQPKTGRVTLTLPTLAESGNSVRLKVQVDSLMTAEEYVQSIHILSEKNPRPVIARFSLGPHAGRAEVSTRIRLAGTQQVVAVAVMNDGTAWMAMAEVVVTAAACVEGG